MKNRFCFAVFLIISSYFVFSCKSIPKPTKTNSCMVYCNLYTSIYTNVNFDNVDFDRKVVRELRFRNIKTNKFITLKEGRGGEYYATNIPHGTYIFHSFKSWTYLKDGKKIFYVLKLDKNKTTNFHFIPVGDSVINLGVIKIDYKYISSANTDWHIYWGEDLEKSYERFERNHPDSPWLDKEWISCYESLERNLTLFP